MVRCVSSVSIPWAGERFDVPAFGLLSLAVDMASCSRTTFPLAGIVLEHDAALLVGSQSTPPSARVFNVDGFPCVIGELV